jgi:hypothetical protein
MTRLEAGLIEVIDALDELKIPYMLIGGLAVAQWNVPRSTLDIDVSVWVEPDRWEAVVQALSVRFAPKTADPLAFVRETHVLPAITSQGIPVDIVFAMWPMEREAIEHGVTQEFEGRQLRVTPLEYLLFLKFTSDREKDFDDAARLYRRHRGKFDEAWLRDRLTEVADALGHSSILERLARVITS